MTNIRTPVVMYAVVLGLAACSDIGIPESDVFTLCSTNFPNDYGRSGVATFDMAKEPINSQMCQEAAELFQADFERRKRDNGWNANTKMRYWCEKGRFKK